MRRVTTSGHQCGRDVRVPRGFTLALGAFHPALDRGFGSGIADGSRERRIRPVFRRRLNFVSLGLLVLGLIITARLVDLQIIEGERYRRMAAQGSSRSWELPGVRGAILDCEGLPITRDACSYAVAVIPSQWRERSLIHAVVDARILLDPAALDSVPSQIELQRVRSPEDIIWAFLLRPLSESRALLSLKASELVADNEEIRSRGQALLDGTWALARSDEELESRLRSILGILLERKSPVKRSELVRLSESGETLGEALGLDAERLAQRIAHEAKSLEQVGASVGCRDQVDTWRRLGGLLVRERAWIAERIEQELRDILLLEEFGGARAWPEGIGGDVYAKLVRSIALPFPSDEIARRTVAGAHALLGGGLILGNDAREDSETERLPSEDPLEAARKLGLHFDHAERLREAWFDRVRKSPTFDRREHLDGRRERELRNGFRGARPFQLGRGAELNVADRVAGPGGLADQGFVLVPMFRRDADLIAQQGNAVRLLLGEMTEEVREVQGRGLEASVDAVVRGEPGLASLDDHGDVQVVRPVTHGRSVETTLHLGYQARLQAALAAAALDGPGGIAVLDARTGAILGVATSPLPEDVPSALETRRRLEMEATILLRMKSRGHDWAVQRLSRLRVDPLPGASMEIEHIEGALELSLSGIDARRHEIAEELATSGAYHRAIDTPEYLPPGSVFKAVTILTGLEQGVIHADSEIPCIRDARATYHRCKGHGLRVDPILALKKSCNAYCYEVGGRVGTRSLVNALEGMGFFDAVPGLLGAEPELKADLLADDAINLSIGMGSLRCSPVRAAGIAASLAMGRAVRPHLYIPEGFEPLGERIGSAAHLEIIERGMRAVVEPGGTAGDARGTGLSALRVAAKTGTADYVTQQGVKIHQAWFVGYAPAGTDRPPEIAFAVVINHTKEEGAESAPIARRAILDFFEVFPERRWP